MRNSTLASAIALSMLAGVAQAQTLFFSEGFEGTPAAGWSSNLIVNDSERPAFSRFGGRYTNDVVSLTLNAFTPRDSVDGPGDGPGNDNTQITYDLSFDLYVIDTWDGAASSFGPDTLRVQLDGATIFEETFANQHTNQSFREPDVGREALGFQTAGNDSIYRDIDLRFTLPSDQQTFTIAWQGLGLQARQDESWGIDNVFLTAMAIPTPGTMGLLALGSGLALRRRRAAA